LLSKKLPGIGIFPVELKVRWEATAKVAQALQQLITAGFPRNREVASIEDVHLNVVAFPQTECLDNGAGKPDGEAVSPFCNPHAVLLSDIRLTISISSAMRSIDG
jgi:hypothetical protein